MVLAAPGLMGWAKKVARAAGTYLKITLSPMLKSTVESQVSGWVPEWVLGVMKETAVVI
jgi:hypothetical protein